MICLQSCDQINPINMLVAQKGQFDIISKYFWYPFKELIFTRRFKLNGYHVLYQRMVVLLLLP